METPHNSQSKPSDLMFPGQRKEAPMDPKKEAQRDVTEVLIEVLDALNVMRLATPGSAILSAVIFNALIIVALIPLALKGVAYRPVGAAALLRRNLLVYGIGGLIVPFVGIKLVDLIVSALRLA